MSLAAGDLRQRVTIMRPVERDNGKGGTSTRWEALATLWAAVIGQNGREAMIAQAFEGVSYYRVTIRFRSDILDTDQLRYGSQDLNIRSIVDPDGRREQLQILADTASARPTS